MNLAIPMTVLALAFGVSPVATIGDAPRDSAKCCAGEKAARCPEGHAAKCNMSKEECAKKCPASKAETKEPAPVQKSGKPATP